MHLKDKRTLVIGLRRSGVGAANLLKRLGAEVTVTDKKSEAGLKEFIGKLSPSIRLRLNGHPEDIFNGMDLIVISPGVPMDIEPLRKARGKGIEIIGELELAYRVIGAPPPFYAITGTNGKSTTTMLLDLMLKKAGIKTLLGGNIGNAITDEIGRAGAVQCIVVEVSSFQLESIAEFRPRIASILNITPDHFDRYHSMEQYRAAKERIFLNQKDGDFLILNKDDPEAMKVLGSEPRAEVFFFSRKEKVKGVYFKDGTVFSDIGSPTAVISAGDILIKGVHNLENAMAASAMALLAGCPINAVRDALMEFRGLAHRLELVRELDGVMYINDSKGTNIGAVVKSLESFPGPIILIAGGRDKAGNFRALRPLIREKVKAVILIGEAMEKIKDAVGDLTECRFCQDMKDAVMTSKAMADEGDVVLLSPGCASFDMFRDFEDRGMRFKETVAGL